MFSSTVRVEIDAYKAVAKRMPLFAKAHAAMDTQILKDSNQFCPFAEGDLVKSGRVESDGLVTWNMPYARRQYYLADGAHYTTPGTGAKWFERAKALYRDDWVKVAQGFFA